MLTAALIFLILMSMAAYWGYKEGNPTFILITKITLYFSVLVFFVALIVHVFGSVPPIPPTSSLPL